MSQGHLVEFLATLIINASGDLLEGTGQHWFRTSARPFYWLISKEPGVCSSKHFVTLQDYFCVVRISHNYDTWGCSCCDILPPKQSNHPQQVWLEFQYQSCFNFIEEINIKSDAKNVKVIKYQNIIIVLYHCNLSANSLSMITQFLQMSIQGYLFGQITLSGIILQET